MKVLNLYAGIGGNRKLWEDVDVTAVEIDPEVARVYSDYFPNDTVIIDDAHQYLLDHFHEYDFIWSSPPCPTHSKFNNMRKPGGDMDLNYPDMRLYEEIIFLKKFCESKWVVENVVPYYDPLIPAKKVGRHLFWSNFMIGNSSVGHIEGNPVKYWTYNDYERKYGYDLSEYDFNGFNRRHKLRNCVHPEIGLHILNAARNIITKSNTEQGSLFQKTEL